MSSGNLTADRRYAYAQSLKDEGDPAAAADVMAQALELAPDWPEGRFALAELLEAAGNKDAAVAAYHAYLEVAPDDSMGAGAKLALLGERRADALPPAYVQRLFDQYAPRFEESLGKLAYRAPALLRAALEAAAPGRRFARVFDLGCGTGLAGAALRPLTAWLGGVDLSPAMVRVAEQKRIYDHLQAGDMVETLNGPTPCDLIVAADVLVYCGDLRGVFTTVRKALTDDGLFAFTVQRSEQEDFILGAEQRFRHSRRYVRDSLAAAGLAARVMDDAVTRQEKGVDVPGLLVLASPTPG